LKDILKYWTFWTMAWWKLSKWYKWSTK